MRHGDSCQGLFNLKTYVMVIVDTVINRLHESNCFLGYDLESLEEFQLSKSSKSFLYFELPPGNASILIHHIVEGVISQSDICKACVFKDITRSKFPDNLVFTRIISHESNKGLIKSLSFLEFKKSELSFWFFDEKLKLS